MVLLSQEPPGLAPNRDRRDAPPRRVLPLVVVVAYFATGWQRCYLKLLSKQWCKLFIISLGLILKLYKLY